MKYLYLLVWEYDDADAEAEWSHFVSDKESISYDEQLRMAKDFSVDLGIADEPHEVRIENVWLNHVGVVDGHRIDLTDIREG